MTEEFIQKSILVHGYKYDYSKTEYVNNLKKVIIICKEHGEFLQLPKIHKRGFLNGEYKIPNTKIKVDGYCQETNTIYEYHGDLWHGNPKLYNKEDTSFFGVKYGELYKKL